VSLKPKVDVSIEGTSLDDKINGGEGDDKIDGKDGNYQIMGREGNDEIEGGEGNDTIDGGNGNDLLDGEEGNDKIKGGAGNDRISGDIGNDHIEGEKGDDKLFGGDGNNILDGGVGNDILVGGKGINIMIGGPDADILICDETDLLTDYDVSEGDQIMGTCSMKFPDQKEKVVEEIPKNKNKNNIFPLTTTRITQSEKFNPSQNFSHPQTSQINSENIPSLSDKDLQKITPFPLPSVNVNDFQSSPDTDSHSSSFLPKSTIQ
jgi:RTX calcium-binding nonapeptide repeat (4 copies)